MKRTNEQNKRMWQLLTAHELGDNGDACAVLAEHFSNGRTSRTSELEVEECEQLIAHLDNTLVVKQKTMHRLRWRLMYLFAESKYEGFRIDGDAKKINIRAVEEYCLKHWKKNTTEMSQRELEKYIAIVRRWG